MLLKLNQNKYHNYDNKFLIIKYYKLIIILSYHF